MDLPGAFGDSRNQTPFEIKQHGRIQMSQLAHNYHKRMSKKGYEARAFSTLGFDRRDDLEAVNELSGRQTRGNLLPTQSTMVSMKTRRLSSLGQASPQVATVFPTSSRAAPRRNSTLVQPLGVIQKSYQFPIKRDVLLMEGIAEEQPR